MNKINRNARTPFEKLSLVGVYVLQMILKGSPGWSLHVSSETLNFPHFFRLLSPP